MSRFCEDVIDTSIGQLLVVDDEEMTLDDAMGYCKKTESNAVASIKSLKVLEEIRLATDCHSRNNNNKRTGLNWLSGLQLNGGKGSWIDGTEYNESLHGTLFVARNDKPSPEDGCKAPVVYPSKKAMLNTDCSRTSNFFCLISDDEDDLGGGDVITQSTGDLITQSTGNFKTTMIQTKVSLTTTAAEVGFEESSTDSMLVTVLISSFIALVLIVFVIIVALLLVRRRRLSVTSENEVIATSHQQGDQGTVYNAIYRQGGDEAESSGVYDVIEDHTYASVDQI